MENTNAPAGGAETRTHDRQTWDALLSSIQALTHELRDSYDHLHGVRHDNEVERSLVTTSSTLDKEVGALAAKKYAERRKRPRFVAKRILGEPGWDILLYLVMERVAGRETSIKAACIGSCVATTTGLRWIDLLAKEGLIVRSADPTDRRRQLVALTDSTYLKMAEFLTGQPGEATER